jgi:hypothetical protein
MTTGASVRLAYVVQTHPYSPRQRQGTSWERFPGAWSGAGHRVSPPCSNLPGCRSNKVVPDRVGSFHDARASFTSSGPKHRSASYALWLLHRSSRFSTVGGPPVAYGVTWWNSRKPRSVQRPFEPMKAHCPPSRAQTCRLTAAGMRRDPGEDPRVARGRSVAASFVFSRFARSSVNARSKIAAGSPVGLECRRRSWARRSFSYVSRDRELNLVPIRRERTDGGRTRRWRRDVGRRHNCRVSLNARTIAHHGAFRPSWSYLRTGRSPSRRSDWGRVNINTFSGLQAAVRAIVARGWLPVASGVYFKRSSQSASLGYAPQLRWATNLAPTTVDSLDCFSRVSPRSGASADSGGTRSVNRSIGVGRRYDTCNHRPFGRIADRSRWLSAPVGSLPTCSGAEASRSSDGDGQSRAGSLRATARCNRA